MHSALTALQGNKSTEMMVFTHRERLAADKETGVERYEALQLGVAVQLPVVLDLRPALVKGSLRQHLETCELLS